MLRRFSRVLAVVTGLILLVAGGVAAVYQTSQRLPDFYARALAEERDLANAGLQVEATILDVSQQVRRYGKWEAVFSERDINGWLAAEMPRKFPDALPPSVHDPRIAIHDDRVQLAFRYNHSAFSGVVTITGDVFSTEHPNVIGVRLKSVRTGIIPLPVMSWSNQIAAGFTAAGFPMKWVETADEPVALITLPTTLTTVSEKRIAVDTIELRSQEVRVAGQATWMDLIASLPADHAWHRR